MVPLTIPCTRSMCAAASVSDITRIAGTTPATAPSKRSCTPAAAGGVEDLLAVLGEQLLVRGHDVAAGVERAQHVVARGVDAAHQLDDQVAALEDVVEVAAAAGQDAGDLGPAADLGLDAPARSSSSSGKAGPTVPWPSRPMRNGSAVTQRQIFVGLAADDDARVAVPAEDHRRARHGVVVVRHRVRVGAGGGDHEHVAHARVVQLRRRARARRPTRSACRRSCRASPPPKRSAISAS